MLTADWSTKVITIPQSDLNLIEGTRYSLSVDYYYLLMRELNGSVQGIIETVNAPLFENTSPTSTTPRIVNVINGYTVYFEGSGYSVDIVDGNTNFREVEVVNLAVGVATNNTSALINPVVLEASVFAGRVVIDPIKGHSGVGKTATGELIGTFRAPSNNIADSILIAKTQGVVGLLLTSGIAIDEDLSGGLTSTPLNIMGTSPFHIITLNSVADLTGVSFTNLSLTGATDGVNTIRESSIFEITGFSGFCFQTNILGNVEIIGNTSFLQCFSGESGTGSATMDVTTGDLVMRDFSGSVTLDNIASGTHSIGIYGGRVRINATCSAGTIHVRGDAYEIIDNSGAGCTVIDQRSTSSLSVTQDLYLEKLHEAHFNKRTHNQGTDTLTIYDTDKVTPKHVFDVTPDLSSISPK